MPKEQYNPEVLVGIIKIPWKSEAFYELLMGSTNGAGGMNELHVLSLLWSQAPLFVSYEEIGTLFGYQESDSRSNVEKVIGDTRAFIGRENHPLRGSIEIETNNYSYRLKANSS